MKIKLKGKNESIHKLKDNLSSVVDDTTLLQSHFEVRVKEINELTKNFDKIKEENEELQKQIFSEQNNINTQLKEKDQKIQLLQLEIKQNKTESENKILKLAKTNDFLKNEFASIIKQYKEKLSTLQHKVILQEKQLRTLKDFKSENSLQQIKTQLSETKTMCEKLSQLLNKNEKIIE